MKVKGISSESTVVPGISEVIDLLSFKILFISVDLPTFGLPINAILFVFFVSCRDGSHILNTLSTRSDRPLLVFAEISNDSLIPSSENSYFLRVDFCLSHLLTTRIIFY